MKCARRAATRTVGAFLVSVTMPVAATASGQPPGAGEDGVRISATCPALFVLGVQGTGQSSTDASRTEDTGMLASVLAPLTGLGDGRLVDRAYVPYSASFGGATPGTDVTYSDSATEGLTRLREMAGSVAERCPRSQLGLIGYSQGAHVVSMFAREVGDGAGAVSADRVAAVALLADPTRSPGAPVFPGLPGRAHPDPAPGTTGAELNAVPEFTQGALTGGGIGPLRDIAADFGALTGRIASLCVPGDLACDAPARTPLLHMIVDILGQAELVPTDPVAALTSISTALSSAVGRAAVTVVNHDLDGYSLGTLSLTPEKPLSVRLAEAADPRVDDAEQEREALLKLGTSALNTLLAMIGVALTPDEVADIADAPDPPAGIDRMVSAIVTASGRPLPRRTVFNLVATSFDALGYLSAEAAELLDPALWLRYSDTVRRHGDYADPGFNPDGSSATELVLTWFRAVAADLAAHRVPGPVAVAADAPGQPDPPRAVEQPVPDTVGHGPAAAASDRQRRTDRVADIASTRPASPFDTDLVALLSLLACALFLSSTAYFVFRLRRPPYARFPVAVESADTVELPEVEITAGRTVPADRRIPLDETVPQTVVNVTAKRV
ncbi:cutinase family protein [Nocardia arizonensis]|uniref:cutinase family protein n=1 Tax=Nocardia arizonensis TaxID=1141647 RepID=UPI0006D205FD|nr:cutinase family protein [Nocardia arizonensis]